MYKRHDHECFVEIVDKFICIYYEYSEDKELSVASAMADKKASVKVEFTRRENAKEDKKEKKICINKLIELNEAIFN